MAQDQSAPHDLLEVLRTAEGGQFVNRLLTGALQARRSGSMSLRCTQWLGREVVKRQQLVGVVENLRDRL